VGGRGVRGCIPHSPSRSATALLVPSLPLEVAPNIGGLGSAVSSPSGVWGRASAEIEFCGYFTLKSDL